MSFRYSDFGILSPVNLNGDGHSLDLKFSNNISTNKKLLYDLLKRNLVDDIYEVPFINAATWLIPRKVLMEVGGFDPIFSIMVRIQLLSESNLSQTKSGHCSRSLYLA